MSITNRIRSAIKQRFRNGKTRKWREVVIETYVVYETTYKGIMTYAESYTHEDFVFVTCCVVRYTLIRNRIEIRFRTRSDEVRQRFLADLKAHFSSIADNCDVKY